MLVLTRSQGEQVIVNLEKVISQVVHYSRQQEATKPEAEIVAEMLHDFGDSIVIRVGQCRSTRVSLGFKARTTVPIHREEVL